MKMRILFVVLALLIAGTTQLDAQVQMTTKRYRTATTYNGTKIDLFMDIYWDPSVFSVTGCSSTDSFHEVAMFMHGGYFLVGNKREFGSLCYELASRGFVAATISYRLGGYSGGVCTPDNSANLMRTVYRAGQDAHAAMNWLKNNIQSFVPSTKVDNIYFGGYSAGAMTALSSAFLDQSEVDNDYPFLTAELGPIAEKGVDRIYPSIAISIGGGINGNLDYVINNSRKTYVLAFAGSNDGVVPYYSGSYAGCQFSPTIYGAGGFASRLDREGYCYRTITQMGAGHDAFTSSSVRPYVLSEIVAYTKAVRKSLWGQYGCTGSIDLPYSSAYVYETAAECKNHFGKMSVQEDDISVKEESGSISYAVLNLNTQRQPVLSLNLSGRTDVKIQMYTINGTLVSTIANANLGSGNYEYAVPDVTPGVYMLRISGGDYLGCEKVVVP